jgi:hypothetical protein
MGQVWEAISDASIQLGGALGFRVLATWFRFSGLGSRAWGVLCRV